MVFASLCFVVLCCVVLCCVVLCCVVLCCVVLCCVVFAGGGAYVVGIVFFIWGQYRPIYHSVWHLFVCLGTTLRPQSTLHY
jgi:channel protein (hemolysin III family)